MPARRPPGVLVNSQGADHPYPGRVAIKHRRQGRAGAPGRGTVSSTRPTGARGSKAGPARVTRPPSWRSSPTRTGTASGTRRSRRSGCGSSTCSTTLLPLLERDLSYARFLLDGQTAVLDDYLEVRPEAAATLARLAASGRLAVGPWMILMDEFMVSGETIVRDLQLGHGARPPSSAARCRSATCPTCSVTSRRCRRSCGSAGLEHAVVWRGVPAAVDQTAFWWEAPDGSRVRAEYLYGSYSNGRDLPDDAKQLVARAHGYELELGDARLPGGGLLLMNGTDHQLPQPWLGRVVAEANAMQDDYQLRRHVARRVPRRRSRPTGLRDVARRAALRRAGQRAHGRRVEPGRRPPGVRRRGAGARTPGRAARARCSSPAERYPTRLLDVAWRQLVLNSAHDSSCACSARRGRRRGGRPLPGGAPDRRRPRPRRASHALARRGRRRRRRSTVVVNPTGATAAGSIDVTRPGRGSRPLRRADDGTPCPTQVLARRSAATASPRPSSARRCAGCSS